MGNFIPFTKFELGRQDFERGESRGVGWTDANGYCERLAGWDAAYKDSLEKAAGGLRRIHAGRYESEDGQWAIVETSKRHWALLFGVAPGYRSRSVIDNFPTFTEAMAGLRAELGQFA